MNDPSADDALCERCGSPAPGGLCPRCVMAQIVEPTGPGAGSSMLPPFEPAELSPHFPQLEILECLGRGGMGVVYKARQKSLNRLVALKLLAPERADDSDFARRFAKEAQALAALSHPNIVAVHDFGEAGGLYYLLMEFVDGVNLRQLLCTRRLEPKEALSIVPPICDALQCAHARGIVHRDIKPENLLLDRTGQVKIADFGIAKLLGGGREEAAAHRGKASEGSSDTFATGTPDYAAPEQRAVNGTADHRADIYSLGVVLYEMLTGERPKGKFVPPSHRVQVDVRIDEILLRALERTPSLRFATMEEFRTRLNSVRHGGFTAQPAVRTTAKWAGLLVLPALALIVSLYALSQNPVLKRPKVIKTVPGNGDLNVDPATKQIRIVFDRPMSQGMSVVGGGPTFPQTLGDTYWEDERTFILAWELEPEHDYWLSINNGTFTNFRGVNGEPCIPYPVSFRTGKSRVVDGASDKTSQRR
jgi:serine/threonine protein kinase